MKKEKQEHTKFELFDGTLDIKKEDYPHYFCDLEIDCFTSQIYKYEDYYMLLDFDFVKNTCWTSIIHIGGKNQNILTPSINLLNKISKNFKIGFCWEKGYKSEILIKRLQKNFKLVKEGQTPQCKYIILK